MTKKHNTGTFFPMLIAAMILISPPVSSRDLPEQNISYPDQSPYELLCQMFENVCPEEATSSSNES